MSSAEKCQACGHLFGGAGTVHIATCPNCGAARPAWHASQAAYPYASPTTTQQATLYPGINLTPASLSRMHAESKVAGPSSMLMVWGGLLFLLAAGLVASGFGGVLSGAATDPVETVALFAAMALFQAITGGVLVAGGTFMRQLRAYGFALGAILFGIIASFFLCLPLCLLGIWPLIVLLDPQVKQAFYSPQPQPFR